MRLSNHILLLTAWLLFRPVDFWSQLAQTNQLRLLRAGRHQVPVTMETILKERKNGQLLMTRQD